MDGKKEGKWVGYYDNGNIIYERHWKYGTMDGDFVEYYENL